MKKKSVPKLNEDTAVALMKHAGKDIGFWGWAVEAAAYVSQLVPQSPMSFPACFMRATA
ncbi:MAG: hypothetical protein SGCHY_003093, partial [Lobulomycetales sp.]